MTIRGRGSYKVSEKHEKTIAITQKVNVADDDSPRLEPFLIQISGKDTGQVHALKGKTVKLGRDPTCSILLDDQHISRVHAEITQKPNGDLFIKDLGSTNGVFVNGIRIDEQQLLDGDKVLIGTRVYFKFTYQDALEQTYQQNLFNAANVDTLTQVYNKKYFSEALAKEFSFSKRNRQPLSLLMIDVDFFKKINDSYGHIAGDLVLRTIGTYLSKNLRLENTACRYGGEEFAVILRGVNNPTAQYIAERVRNDVEKLDLNHRGKFIRVTVSIGIATLDDEDFATAEDLVQKADEHLYHAKQTGRNKTVFRQAA